MRTLRVFAIAFLLTCAAAGSASAVCGDGVIDGDESCDGTDFGGATCATVTDGFVRGGSLLCNPDCTLNTDDCRRAFLESLVPARAGKPRCQLEWTAAGTTIRGPIARRNCTDGDPECDEDRDFNLACLMELQLCLNVPDPKVSGCPYQSEPGKVFRVQVLQPKAFANPEAVMAILGAAEDLARAGGVAATVGSDSVAFSPPVTAAFQCGRSTIRIPLRGTAGRARPGKLKIRAKSSDNSGKVRAVGSLTLVCNP